jgi:hypothetical protein
VKDPAAVPHTDGILRAHGIEHQPDAGIIARALDSVNYLGKIGRCPS